MVLPWCANYYLVRAVFVDPKTGDILQEGDIFKRDNFCKTLQLIAENGAEEFYTGGTAKKLISELSEAGGILTLEDLKSYK